MNFPINEVTACLKCGGLMHKNMPPHACPTPTAPLPPDFEDDGDPLCFPRPIPSGRLVDEREVAMEWLEGEKARAHVAAQQAEIEVLRGERDEMKADLLFVRESIEAASRQARIEALEWALEQTTWDTDSEGNEYPVLDTWEIREEIARLRATK